MKDNLNKAIETEQDYALRNADALIRDLRHLRDSMNGYLAKLEKAYATAEDDFSEGMKFFTYDAHHAMCDARNYARNIVDHKSDLKGCVEAWRMLSFVLSESEK